MTRTIWESRSWLSRFSFCVWSLIIGLTVVGFGTMLTSISIGRIYYAGILGGAFLCVVGFLVVLFYLFSHERIYQSGEGKSLAMIDSRGVIDGSGFKKIYLKPWPFKSRLKVVEYPTEFAFRTSLHPITSNPKVIPLDVSVTVGFEKSVMTPRHLAPNFPDFLFNPESYKTEFYKNVFEALQHNLPQELANRINPYDPRTVSELTDYVQRALIGKLPFYDCSVHCAVKENGR